MSGDYECNICLETAVVPAVTICGHLFCTKCIDHWLSSPQHNHNQCPVCKGAVTSHTVFPVLARQQQALKVEQQAGELEVQQQQQQQQAWDKKVKRQAETSIRTQHQKAEQQAEAQQEQVEVQEAEAPEQQLVHKLVTQDLKTAGCFDCNACLSTAAEPVVAYCGHLFCWYCLFMSFLDSKACPVCESPTSEGSVIPIYIEEKKKRKWQQADVPLPPRPPAKRVESDTTTTRLSRTRESVREEARQGVEAYIRSMRRAVDIFLTDTSPQPARVVAAQEASQSFSRFHANFEQLITGRPARPQRRRREVPERRRRRQASVRS